jgi:hypothetical protein
VSTTTPFLDLLALLRRLQEAHIHYKLSSFRDNSIAVEVAVPGERWEIEFMVDGSVEIERFISDGSIGDERLVDDLFARFSD